MPFRQCSAFELQLQVRNHGRDINVAAALANATLAHCLDFDDTHLATVIHPTSVVASALLALAAELGPRPELLVTWRCGDPENGERDREQEGGLVDGAARTDRDRGGQWHARAAGGGAAGGCGLSVTFVSAVEFVFSTGSVMSTTGGGTSTGGSSIFGGGGGGGASWSLTSLMTSAMMGGVIASISASSFWPPATKRCNKSALCPFHPPATL